MLAGACGCARVQATVVICLLLLGLGHPCQEELPGFILTILLRPEHPKSPGVCAADPVPLQHLWEPLV